MADIETLRREFEDAFHHEPLRSYKLGRGAFNWCDDHEKYTSSTTQYLFVGFCAGRKASQAEIEELKAKLKPHEEDPGGYLAVGGFVAEIERLQSIVDRIPKFADGSPAFDDGPAWHPSVYCEGWADVDMGVTPALHRAIFVVGDLEVIHKPLSECYPTREAMEKANM